MEVETRVKTVSTDVNRDDCLKIVMKKKVGRPCKIKRGRPKRIIFPRLPKPPQLKFSSGCSVKGCTNPDKWMYSLPEAENLREQWLEFISRPDWTPDSSARVCEIHFGREMWKKSRDGYRTLLPDAIPTLTEPECGIEDSKSFNFVDVLNLEESEVFVNSELLEPEIDMSEEPYDSLLSLSTEQEAVLQAKSRKQQYLINIKQNPAKYSEYLQKERMRHKIRRKSLQTLPHSIEEEQFNEQSLDMHQELLERATEGSIDQFPSIKVEHLYTMEEEAIVPDLVFPSNNNMEIMENVNSDKSEDTSNNPLSSNLVLEKGYRCPICGKYLARKASLKYHLEKTHPHENMTVNIREFCEQPGEEMWKKRSRLQNREKANERVRRYRERLTEEQLNAKRTKDREQKRLKRKQMDPNTKALVLEKERERKRKERACETPLQAEIKREKERIYKRLLRARKSSEDMKHTSDKEVIFNGWDFECS